MLHLYATILDSPWGNGLEDSVVGSCSLEGLIQSPQGAAGEKSGGEQMHIHPAQPFTEKLTPIDHPVDFTFFRDFNLCQRLKKRQYLSAIFQVAAGQFTDHKGVGKYKFVFNEVYE